MLETIAVIVLGMIVLLLIGFLAGVIIARLVKTIYSIIVVFASVLTLMLLLRFLVVIINYFFQ